MFSFAACISGCKTCFKDAPNECSVCKDEKYLSALKTSCDGEYYIHSEVVRTLTASYFPACRQLKDILSQTELIRMKVYIQGKYPSFKSLYIEKDHFVLFSKFRQ